MEIGMKTILNIIILIICITTYSCTKTDKEKLNVILNSEKLRIQVNTYGGIGGYGENVYHYKKKEHENLIIANKGTDYQTFIRVDEEKLKHFIIESFISNDPNKSMSGSCITGIDHEYIIKTGLTESVLRPSERCDSLFYNIKIK